MHQIKPEKAERISVFDIFKIGVGPSSSHTLGPWRAALRCIYDFQKKQPLSQIARIQVLLYGSLAKTGVGHGTDFAILAGLLGEDPVICDTERLPIKIEQIKKSKKLYLGQKYHLSFDYQYDMKFLMNKNLPYHPNGMTFRISLKNNSIIENTYYSVGGGFVVKENETETSLDEISFPYPIETALDLAYWCKKNKQRVSEVVWENEKKLRSPSKIKVELLNIWTVMKNCIYQGCHTKGFLPGGLQVKRRAFVMNQKLLPPNATYQNCDEWFDIMRHQKLSFVELLRKISCFAMAVNEQNAAFQRVVTAPTNGAAGVIPAVLAYDVLFNAKNEDSERIVQFLLTAGEIGSLFKKGATISAAAGGCQAEIGVSSAMAAGALTECLGGSPEQVQIAAEIAMEHHLGMTCDPIAGLVQIPCIERNSMGAIKAITAAQIALDRDANHAKVPLDSVIKTMWETAQDMHSKYKETSDGGLAVNVSVNIPEC